jgi:hypothetical protein
VKLSFLHKFIGSILESRTLKSVAAFSLFLTFIFVAAKFENAVSHRLVLAKGISPRIARLDKTFPYEAKINTSVISTLEVTFII